jgi:hypothetical protein
MKRSEMVKHISVELQDIVQENYIDEQGFEWCANLILLRLEELGMLPPDQNKDIEPPCAVLTYWEEE